MYKMFKNNIEETDSGFSLKGKVYFIFQQGDDKRCKIGKSVNPNNRKDQLQTGNPDELYVYKTLVGYSSLENNLHKKFKDKQIRNTEWFYLTKEEVDIIIQEYTSEKSVVTAPESEKCEKTCQKSFICNKCEKMFTTAYGLRKHKNKKTPCIPNEVPVININSNENKCTYCERYYSNNYSLKRHTGTCPMKNNQTVMFQMIATLFEENKQLREKNDQLLIFQSNNLTEDQNV